MVRTGEKGDSKGISAWLFEKGTLVLPMAKRKIKWYARLRTPELILINCRVPKENLLGKQAKAFKQAMTILDGDVFL